MNLTAIASIFISIGIFSISSEHSGINQRHYQHFKNQNDSLVIKIIEELRPNDYSSRYIGLIRRINGHRATGKVLLVLRNSSGERVFQTGDLLATISMIHPINQNRNPGEFNRMSWAKKKGIYDRISVDANQVVTLENRPRSFKSRALKFRDSILDSLRNHKMSKENFSVFAALVLGYRHDLPLDLVAQYRTAGAMHLLAISGLHLGILLIILNFWLKFLNRFRNGRTVRLSVLLICLWSYAFLTGMSVSVFRSVLMFSALCMGLIFEKKAQLGQYMIVSMFILLLIRPEYLFDVGFQLSYAALFAIIWLSPLIKNVWRPRFRMVRYFWDLIGVSVAAQIGVLPLSLFYFNEVSGLFLISSLVLIPVLGIVLGLGILLIVLDRFELLADEMIEGYEILIELMNEFIKIVSRLHFMVLDKVFFTVPLVIFSYLTLYYVVIFIMSGKRRVFRSVLICILCMQAQIIFEKWQTRRSEEMILFHVPRHTLFGIRRGRVFTGFFLKNGDKKIEKCLSDYQKMFLNLEIKYGPLRHFYQMNTSRILLLDNEFWQLNNEFKADLVILSNSPKINLDRMLQTSKPKMILADGSNYTTFIQRWEESCREAGIRFHNTGLKGSFTEP